VVLSDLSAIGRTIGNRTEEGRPRAALSSSGEATHITPKTIDKSMVRQESVAEKPERTHGRRGDDHKKIRSAEQIAVQGQCGRDSDECLNERWFSHLLHARTVIERWRREYTEQ
jgi:hypothetical protein